MNTNQHQQLLLVTQDAHTGRTKTTICTTSDIDQIHSHLSVFLKDNLGIESYARQVGSCGVDIGFFQSFLIKESGDNQHRCIYTGRTACDEVGQSGHVRNTQLSTPTELIALINVLIMEGYLSFDAFALKGRKQTYENMPKIAFAAMQMDGILEIATNDALFTSIEGATASIAGLHEVISGTDHNEVNDMLKKAIELHIFNENPLIERMHSTYNAVEHKIAVVKQKQNSSVKSKFKPLSISTPRDHIRHSLLLSGYFMAGLRNATSNRSFNFECRDLAHAISNGKVANWGREVKPSTLLRDPLVSITGNCLQGVMTELVDDVIKTKDEWFISALDNAINSYYFGVSEGSTTSISEAIVTIPIDTPIAINNEHNELVGTAYTDIRAGNVIVSLLVDGEDGNQMEFTLCKMTGVKSAADHQTPFKVYTLVLSSKTASKSSKFKIAALYRTENRDLLVNKMIGIIYENYSVGTIPIIREQIAAAGAFYSEPHLLNVNITNF